MLTEKGVEVKSKRFEELSKYTQGPLGRTLSLIETLVSDTAAVPMWGFDRNGVIRYWNTACQLLYGYTTTEAVGQRLQDVLLSGQDTGQFDRELEQIWDTGQVTPLREWTLYTRTGQERCVYSVMLPVFERGIVDYVFRIDVDVTKHKWAEDIIHASEERYRALVETIPYGIEEIDLSGRIIFANNSLHKIYGYASGELFGKEVFDLMVSEEEKDKAREYLKSITSTQHLPIPYEQKVLTKDDRIIDVQVNWSYKRDKGGDVVGFISVITDITDHKRAQKEIASLAKSPSENPFPVLRIAGDGTLLYSNNAGLSLLKQWGVRVGKPAPADCRNMLADVLNSKCNRVMEVECCGRFISLVFAPVSKNNYVNVYGCDVTELKKAQQQILELNKNLEKRVNQRTVGLIRAHRQLLQDAEERRSLEKEILHISEREKRLIGEEMHDGIGQQLAGIAFMAKALEQRLGDDSSEETANAAEIAKLVNKVMDQTRSLAKGLHPVDLDASGLQLSLKELAATTRRLFDINCTFKCNKPVTLNNASVAAHLYRITQEAITNAIKHGRTKNIQIQLTSAGNKCMLEIKNDGLDFSEAGANSAGMGLRIIDHRVEMIGGSFDVRRDSEGGTILTCVFPNKKR